MQKLDYAVRGFNRTRRAAGEGADTFKTTIYDYVDGAVRWLAAPFFYHMMSTREGRVEVDRELRGLVRDISLECLRLDVNLWEHHITPSMRMLQSRGETPTTYTRDRPTMTSVGVLLLLSWWSKRRAELHRSRAQYMLATLLDAVVGNRLQWGGFSCGTYPVVSRAFVNYPLHPISPDTIVQGANRSQCEAPGERLVLERDGGWAGVGLHTL